MLWFLLVLVLAAWLVGGYAAYPRAGGGYYTFGGVNVLGLVFAVLVLYFLLRVPPP